MQSWIVTIHAWTTAPTVVHSTPEKTQELKSKIQTRTVTKSLSELKESTEKKELINCKTKLFAANMENIFYKHDETLCSGGSRMKLEAAIKKLPRNAVVYYPRGGQFIQWPTFGGHVTEEWLAKNRCPGEQAPLCGTPLVISADEKIPNSFPATELFIITRLEGGAIRKEGQLGNVIALQRCDQKARENALLKKRVEVLEKKIHQLESGPAAVQKDQEVKISHLNEMQ
ncbi:unnamed protein product [Caenorhabditis nigoni]